MFNLKKFAEQRVRIFNDREAYLIVSKNPLDEVSGYRNSIERFVIKKFDEACYLCYKCRVRFAKSISEAKDTGRIHMLIDQFLTEDECRKFFPEIMEDLDQIKERKRQKTIECQKNRERNILTKEEKKVCKKLTDTHSVKEWQKLQKKLEGDNKDGNL